MKLLRHFQILVVLALSVLFTNCEKKEIYNDLEDHWKLEKFEIKESKQVVYCDRLFFGITYLVTEIAEKNPPFYQSYFARTEYRDNNTKLVLYDFKTKEFANGEPIPATSEQLKAFGIINPDETVFQIVELNRKKLILESDYARLELKRF